MKMKVSKGAQKRVHLSPADKQKELRRGFQLRVAVVPFGRRRQ